MTWQELYFYLGRKFRGNYNDDWNFWHSKISVYDRSSGEFTPADLIEFTEQDNLIDSCGIDKGSIFLEIDP